MNNPRPCRYCSTNVIDGFDTNGKKIVLDARNHPVYIEMPDGTWMRASETTKVSHFVTCKNVATAKADQAKKKQQANNNG